eukprot:1195817-Prorocentrum_minimum.AAC.3
MALLSELRPDAVALVDAFGLDDYFLNSALGAADGDVYARCYDWVSAIIIIIIIIVTIISYIVNCFGLDDYFLNSALGGADGDVYARGSYS